MGFCCNDVFSDRDVGQRPRFVDIDWLVFPMLCWRRRWVRRRWGYDRCSTLLLCISRALDGSSAGSSSLYRRACSVSFFALVSVFFLVPFPLPDVHLCDTLFLEADRTVTVNRTGIAVPTAPLFWDLSLDNIEACCMAPTRADVAGNAEAIVEEKATYATDSVCVWKRRAS